MNKEMMDTLEEECALASYCHIGNKQSPFGGTTITFSLRHFPG
jgi:hypothetical protein